MKKFDFLIIFFTIVFLAFTALYVLGNNVYENSSGREYKVEIERITRSVKETGTIPDLDRYSYVKEVSFISESEIEEEVLKENNQNYAFKKAGDKILKFEYIQNMQNDKFLKSMYGIMMIITGLFTAVLFYIKNKILKPFEKMKNIPLELAKGNLNAEIEEDKNKFFGEFIWGINMLKSYLEDSKNKEMEIQKSKKLLILSLSHDIKTPLSAIKLSASALAKNLYKDEEKKKEAALSIKEKSEEIEKYVNKISDASRKDFLNFEVNMGEFYLSAVLNKINEYYKDKLKILRTEFCIEKYDDCMLQGDFNRVFEIFQNIIENAVKYGDGNFIKISSYEEEDCIIITVSNSGCTLKESELNYIFDSFFRGQNVKSQKGSGLGLYICQSLIRKMNGEIFAEIEDKIMKVSVVIRKI